MAKLNQVIAIEKGIKGRVHSGLTEMYKLVQKPELFNGFNKSYQPIADDGESLPSESKRVQCNASDMLQGASRLLTELFQVTARKDWTNCTALADVKVDDKTILTAVPVTYLLFVEKQLTDLRTFVGEMPVLDDAEEWKKDAHSGLFKSGEVKTHRTKKTQKPIVLYDATDKHPAQTQLITEDVLAGHWSAIKHSGSMPKTEKVALMGRIEKLLNAVKEAREQANMADEITTPEVGEAVFAYLLPQ